MHDYILALLGGAMIGMAAVILMAAQGSILGISGILNQLLPPNTLKADWRISFVLGVLAAPLIAVFVLGYQPTIDITNNLLLLVVGGLLVGIGTLVGNGCTSGHGVCGLSRFAKRSIIATAIFMITAIATVWVMRNIVGV